MKVFKSFLIMPFYHLNKYRLILLFKVLLLISCVPDQSEEDLYTDVLDSVLVSKGIASIKKIASQAEIEKFYYFYSINHQTNYLDFFLTQVYLQDSGKAFYEVIRPGNCFAATDSNFAIVRNNAIDSNLYVYSLKNQRLDTIVFPQHFVVLTMLFISENQLLYKDSYGFYLYNVDNGNKSYLSTHYINEKDKTVPMRPNSSAKFFPWKKDSILLPAYPVNGDNESLIEVHVNSNNMELNDYYEGDDSDTIYWIYDLNKENKTVLGNTKGRKILGLFELNKKEWLWKINMNYSWDFHDLSGSIFVVEKNMYGEEKLSHDGLLIELYNVYNGTLLKTIEIPEIPYKKLRYLRFHLYKNLLICHFSHEGDKNQRLMIMDINNGEKFYIKNDRYMKVISKVHDPKGDEFLCIGEILYQ